MKIFKNNTDIMLKNVIDVCLFVTMRCQLRCRYCFLFQENNEIHHTMTKAEILHIKKCLDMCNNPLSINLMGGEPTESENFQFIMDSLSEIKNLKRINIFTNGVNDLKKYKFNNKIKITLTYHSSQCSPENIIKNIEFLKNSNIPYDIMVPFWDINDNLKKFKKYIEDFGISLNNIFPMYPYMDRVNKIVIRDIFWPELENKKIFELNGEVYSFRELVKLNLNNFCGWSCSHNSYQLMQNGDINWNCGDTVCNIFEHPDFFKNLNIKRFKCENERCVYIQDLCSIKYDI